MTLDIIRQKVKESALAFVAGGSANLAIRAPEDAAVVPPKTRRFPRV
jgi:hypothetical protein